MTRILNLTAPILLVFLLLAGCAAKRADPTAPVDPRHNSGATDTRAVPPAQQPNSTVSREPQVSSKDGSLVVGVGVPVNLAGVPPRWIEVLASKCLGVDVGKNATALVAEVAWKDNTQRLTLHTVAPNQSGDTYVSAGPLDQSPLHLQIASPAEGTWSVCAQADGANANITYTLYGTVFHGPIPDGYTAIK